MHRIGVLAALAASWLVASGGTRPPAAERPPAPLVIRVLDVGQGDATLIENGASRVLIDGGPTVDRMGRLLDSLGLSNTTIDVVILTHAHADHLVGLRALFESKRRIKVRYFFENQDPSAAVNLAVLRDSVSARIDRDGLVYRDTDDPCANGRPVCTITLDGGAKLHIMRPMPRAGNANDRSTAVKVVAADSAFSMWIAGDAEQTAIEWFLGRAHYDRNPGMRVDVLKANHHGSCNGVTAAYLEATRPQSVVASVGRKNGYGHMHEQAKALYRKQRVPWYRTDQNGTIELRAPGVAGERFTIVARGKTNARGLSDERSRQAECRPNP